MKKILKGLPIVISGLVLFLTPIVIFGEVGLNMLALILLFTGLCALAYAIGDMING